MPLPEPTRSCLTDEERKRARAVVVKKSLRYFEDRNNRSFSEDCLFTRRRNLAAHLGIDETVSKKELNMINVHALPLPSSVQKTKATSKGLNKRESIESSVQCPSEDGFDDIGLIEDVENNQGDDISVSCTSNSSQPNYQTIVGDDDDISISSSVDTCRQSNCQNYTCCENESCGEEHVNLNQCPQEANGENTDIYQVPETEYKVKDLTNYLGMLDCVSSSIVEHKVSITNQMLSRSAQTSFSSKNLSILGKSPDTPKNLDKHRIKLLTASDRSVSLPRITALRNLHASHQKK